MKNYEIMFIIKPTLEEEKINNVVAQLKKVLIDNGSTNVEETALGKKDLAYEINKTKSGYYFLFNVETNDINAINEFNRICSLSKDVIRHLVTKKE